MMQKTYLALAILAGALAIFALPLQAQEKTSPNAPAGQTSTTKKSNADRVEERPKPAADEKVPVAQDLKGKGVEARDQANDFWISPRGAFHMTGATGRGIYEAWGKRDDTFRFADALPVGGRVGWTYKADGWALWLFFSRDPSSAGKFEVMWSLDNQNFNHYAWAD